MGQANDSITLLPIKKSLIDRLTKNGYTSIRQLKTIIENNDQIRIQQISGVGSKKFAEIKKAVLEFDTENKGVGIVLDVDKIKETMMGPKVKQSVNKHDVGNILLEFLLKYFNDNNFPKYPIGKGRKYPHNEILYNDLFVLVNSVWLDKEFGEYMKENYNVFSVENFQAENALRLATANLRYVDNTPLDYTVADNGRYYALSGYPMLTGGCYDKYIKVIRDKFELKMNKTIDFTMNDVLSEEWARFDQEQDTLTNEDEDTKWHDSKVLSEVYANQKKFDFAANTVITYCNDYYRRHNNSYTGINMMVRDYLKKYLISVKTELLKKDLTKTISKIEADNDQPGMSSAMRGEFREEKKRVIIVQNPAASEVKQEAPKTVTPPLAPVVEEKVEERKPTEEEVKQVLNKDLKKLPEELRKGIIEDILPPLHINKKKYDFDLVINACVAFGDNCNVMATVLTRVVTDKFNFTTTTDSINYMFNKSTPEAGNLVVPDSLKSKEADIRENLISQINEL